MTLLMNRKQICILLVISSVPRYLVAILGHVGDIVYEVDQHVVTMFHMSIDVCRMTQLILMQ